MKDTNTLILSGSGYELAVAPEAEALKQDLITASAAITAVINPDDNATAREQVKKLAALRNLCEKSRNQVKSPVLKIGKDIDQKAKDFVLEIETEEKRLSKLMGDYAAEVERERVKVMREIEAKRQAEEKAAREAEAARIKAEQEAEAARIAAEKAEWESTTPEEEAAAAAALKLAEEIKANGIAAAEAARLAEEARKAEETKVVAFIPEKAAGVKFTADFEVTDIDAIYRYSPTLVTMEAKRKDILDLIKALGADEDNQIIPGIKITKKAVISTR